MEFKIRASAASEIMATPKKGALISVGAQSYVKKWMKEQIYGYQPVYSKYTEKGNMCELEALEYYNPFLEKNFEKFEDDFFTGEPDAIDLPRLYDIKCPWSHETFPLFESELTEKAYHAQGQVYMHLTGAKKHTVVYVLMNTPTELDRTGLDYSDLGREHRIKEFTFDYDEKFIKDLQDKVLKCREYLKTIV